MISKICVRHHLGPASSYLPQNSQLAAEEEPIDPSGFDGPPPDFATPTSAPPRAMSEEIKRLVEFTRSKARSLEEVCDRLGKSPSQVKRLITDAQAEGFTIEVAHDHIGFRLPEPIARETRDTGVAPTVGGLNQVLVVSDTHLGSKYCLRAQLRDCIDTAYAQGVREVLHAGDVLDGKYSHSMFELTHAGIEDQSRDLFEVLPRKPGLTYHAISGNHDDTFADAVGMSPGDYIVGYFKSKGRNDLTFYGRRGAYLKHRGAIIELWHPRSGGSYSLSYHLQNHIRDYGVGRKPDILIAGHWHIFVYLEQRGVHALGAGTFQGQGSAFSKSLGGSPAIGGTILSWEITKTRTLRKFGVQRLSYYEEEAVRDLVLA